MSKPIVLLLLLAVAALAMGTLVSGAGHLEQTLPGGMPLGNVITALALICPALAAVLISRPRSTCQRASQVAFAAAVLWLPVSLMLAGNLTLNFVGSRGVVWLALSLATLMLVVGCLGWSVAARLRAYRPPE